MVTHKVAVSEGGTLYHAIPNLRVGAISDKRIIPIEDAIEEGYKPCEDCYDAGHV